MLVICISFSTGFLLGMYFKTIIFERSSWMVMKWNSDVLGFRPVMIGSKLFKSDKIAMALEIDTSGFPEEGVEVE